MTMGSNSQVVKCGLDLSLRRLGPTGMAGAKIIKNLAFLTMKIWRISETMGDFSRKI
jgi:hypothetical protein